MNLAYALDDMEAELKYVVDTNIELEEQTEMLKDKVFRYERQINKYERDIMML